MVIEFKCPECDSVLKAPKEYAGRSAKCKKCDSQVIIPQLEKAIVLQPETASSSIQAKDKPLSYYQEHLVKLNFPSTINGIPIAEFTDNDAKAICNWGSKMTELYGYEQGKIDEVKYEGHIIKMEDGTRWEVDEVDTSTSGLWDVGDHVVVINDRMYKLDESESVAVEKED
jgi:hypothetical protein